MPHRKAVRVLPDPVGARMRVCSPAAMAAQPCSWAAVGAANDEENQARTGSENRSSAAMLRAYGCPLTEHGWPDHTTKERHRLIDG